MNSLSRHLPQFQQPESETKSRYGARNRFQEPSLELRGQATQAGGLVRHDNPHACLLGS